MRLLNTHKLHIQNNFLGHMEAISHNCDTYGFEVSVQYKLPCTSFLSITKSDKHYNANNIHHKPEWHKYYIKLTELYSDGFTWLENNHLERTNGFNFNVFEQGSCDGELHCNKYIVPYCLVGLLYSLTFKTTSVVTLYQSVTNGKWNNHQWI